MLWQAKHPFPFSISHLGLPSALWEGWINDPLALASQTTLPLSTSHLGLPSALWEGWINDPLALASYTTLTPLTLISLALSSAIWKGWTCSPLALASLYTYFISKCISSCLQYALKELSSAITIHSNNSSNWFTRFQDFCYMFTRHGIYFVQWHR